MNNSALVIIDLQNDITKNYRSIIDGVNTAIDRAQEAGMHTVYIQNESLSAGTRTFKRGTKGFELVPELKQASENIFIKSKANTLTCPEFRDFIAARGISHFYITGADAVGCVKSACFNMKKEGFEVTVIRDCVTSYDLNKLEEMYAYYEAKGCRLIELTEFSRIE